MAAILNFKQFFKPKPKPLTYKHRHFLNSVSEKRLEEILIYSEGEALAAHFSALTHKKIIFMSDQRHKFALKKLMQIEPKTILNVVYQGAEPVKQKQGYHTCLADLNHLPVRKGYFDVYVCPFVFNSDFRWLEKTIQSLSNHLINGQKLILSLKHPGLDQMLINQNPSVAQVSDLSLSRVFETLKKNHLFTESLQEGNVDLSLKPYFLENEHDYYHEYKNTPLCAVFSAVKFARKS